MYTIWFCLFVNLLPDLSTQSWPFQAVDIRLFWVKTNVSSYLICILCAIITGTNISAGMPCLLYVYRKKNFYSEIKRKQNGSHIEFGVRSPYKTQVVQFYFFLIYCCSGTENINCGMCALLRIAFLQYLRQQRFHSLTLYRTPNTWYLI